MNYQEILNKFFLYQGNLVLQLPEICIWAYMLYRFVKVPDLHNHRRMWSVVFVVLLLASSLFFGANEFLRENNRGSDLITFLTNFLTIRYFGNAVGLGLLCYALLTEPERVRIDYP
jgi:hypothetical protein